MSVTPRVTSSGSMPMTAGLRYRYQRTWAHTTTHIAVDQARDHLPKDPQGCSEVMAPQVAIATVGSVTVMTTRRPMRK